MPHSPVVGKIKEKNIMSFADAMQEVINGNKVARLEWNNNDYFFLQASIVHIKNDKGIHTLKLSEGDILGNDYVVVD